MNTILQLKSLLEGMHQSERSRAAKRNEWIHSLITQCKQAAKDFLMAHRKNSAVCSYVNVLDYRQLKIQKYKQISTNMMQC